MYDDAQDAIAAEYVLGTLSVEERQHAEALLAIDTGFAEAVRVWERRLGELNVMVEAVEPRPQIWNKIRSQITDMAPGKEIPPAAVPVTPPEPQPEQTTSSAESLSQVASIVSSLVPSSADQSAEKPAEPPAALIAPPPAEPVREPSPPPLLPLAPAPAAAGAKPKIERSADVIYLSRRVNYWRRTTVAFGAIAALLAIFVAVALLAPGSKLAHLTSQPSTAGLPAPPGAQLVAVLQQDPTAPAFLLTIDPQGGKLIVRRVSATPDPGHSYELWLISNSSSSPRSLGIVGNDEFTERAIPSGFDVGTIRTASYAVSLEPTGGSPSGVPTGPILFTGKIVESVPAATPQTPHS